MNFTIINSNKCQAKICNKNKLQKMGNEYKTQKSTIKKVKI